MSRHDPYDPRRPRSRAGNAILGLGAALAFYMIAAAAIGGLWHAWGP